MQNGSIRKALTDRYVVVPLLTIGSLLLSLGCGEPAGPDYARLAITTVSLPNARRTVPYSDTLAAAGGDSSYTWSVTSGSLPAGLSLTAATGVIAGTPSVEGSSAFTVQVASGDGQTDTQQLTITVYATLAITTTWLSNAVLNVPYSDTLMAAGGDSVYSWSVTVGSLPTGFSLNTSTGVISGTPSVVGSNTFTVQVASGDGQTDTQQKTITVATTAILQPDELCSDYPDSAVVTFEDVNLELAIRRALWFSDQEDLTCGLILDVTFLQAGILEITSLAGIQNLRNLAYLELQGNVISDISALSGLTSLTKLVLFGNSISDISALSELASLEVLDLSSNSITDINALSGLTSLTSLDLGNDSISDVSALSGLTSLEQLSLCGNQIENVSVLSGLTSLTSLDLRNNSISDVSALDGLTSLASLYLDNNSISDISALTGLTSLTRLWLRYNSISDISALGGLTSLDWLELYNNAINDIGPLSGLTSLMSLDLTRNSISDIGPLSGLTSLGRLSLAFNSITDISALSGLTSLASLYLDHNSISDISALSGLTSLTGLNLNDNAISDISALSGLTTLTILRLHDNTNLADIQPLLDNTGLGVGDQVTLGGTNVTCTDVAALQAKGVSVASDCP